MQCRTGGGMAVSSFPSPQVKTKVVIVIFSAATWQSIPFPDDANKILSLRIVTPSALNGYFLIWNAIPNNRSITALRCNTSGSSIVLIQEAHEGVWIEVTYI